MMLTPDQFGMAYDALQRCVDAHYDKTHPFHSPIWDDATIALREIKLGIAAQQARIAELEKDAARYRWLRDKMLGVDFDWNESGLTALSFEMPEGCAYGGNCDQNIDAAMQKDRTT